MKRRFFFVALLFVAVFSFAASQVARGVEPFYNITGLYLRSDEASVGDKLYVDLYMIKKDDSTKITGIFENGVNHPSLQLKDLNTRNPYFEISSYMQAGTTYRLSEIIVEDSEGKIVYYTTPGGNNYMNLLGKDTVKIDNKPVITGLELLGDRSIDVNGNLRLELRTDQEVEYVSVVLQNKNVTSMNAIVYIKANEESVIELSKLGSRSLSAGDYNITDVFLNPGDQSTYVHYSTRPQDGTMLLSGYDTDFKIIGGQNSKQGLKSDFLRGISLVKNDANLNEEIGVKIDADGEVRAATLIFAKDGESMTVNVKGLNSDSAYFVVPFTTGAGEYELSYVILKDGEGEKYHYRKGEDFDNVKHFDFNISLNVRNEVVDGGLLSLDNSKITSEIIDKIKELEGNIVIEINGDDDPVITKELFEAIQGSDKTLIIAYDGNEWIFNGLDVNEPKQIDVSLKLYDVKSEDVFDEKVQSGIILDFPENGELPGKCLIKIYDSRFVSTILNKADVNVYYYNSELSKFEIVDLGRQYNEDGFYEFYLSHNSMYVMTNDTISDEFLILDDNGSNQKTLFMITTIVLSAVLVVVVAMIWYNIYREKRKNGAEKSVGSGAEL